MSTLNHLDPQYNCPPSIIIYVKLYEIVRHVCIPLINRKIFFFVDLRPAFDARVRCLIHHIMSSGNTTHSPPKGQERNHVGLLRFILKGNHSSTIDYFWQLNKWFVSWILDWHNGHIGLGYVVELIWTGSRPQIGGRGKYSEICAFFVGNICTREIVSSQWCEFSRRRNVHTWNSPRIPPWLGGSFPHCFISNRPRNRHLWYPSLIFFTPLSLVW